MSWTFRPIDMLVDCAEDWQAVNRAATDTPLLDFRFVHDVVNQFATGAETIATYRQDGAPQAMCILTRANRFGWQTLQPPNAPLGLWVCKPSIGPEVLLPSLATAISPQCGMVSVTQQDPELMPRPISAPRLSTLDYIVTASLSFPNSFAEYLRGRSKNFRHNITRQRNRLKRENISTRLEFIAGPVDMAQAVNDYSGLECASWKGQINSAVRMDEPQGRFYLKLMTSFAQCGEGLVFRYFFGERLVASDLCIRRAGTLFILKTACDESYQGLSPAHLMRMEAFAELVDKEDIRKVEFYGPLKDWHTRLTDSTRQMYHINYYRWQVIRLLHEFRLARRKRALADGTNSQRPAAEIEAANDAA